jgi:urease accessory protein
MTDFPAYRVNGCLKLHFSAAANQGQANSLSYRTILHIAEQRPPLRVVRAFELNDGAALVHLHNVSGGVLGGDYLELSANVGPQARAQLTTPGATRIYRHRAGGPEAVQYNHLIVEAGGLLEYLPDPLIPFAQARYRQVTRVELAEGAGLFWWEIVAPGREARDELFVYELLELAVDIRVKQRPIALERLRLQPAQRPLTSPVRLGPYRYLATFYICRVGLPEQSWLELETRLGELSRRYSSLQEEVWAASTLVSDGLVVRALSCSGQGLQEKLAEFWRVAKEALYSEAAIPPRKLY